MLNLTNDYSLYVVWLITWNVGVIFIIYLQEFCWPAQEESDHPNVPRQACQVEGDVSRGVGGGLDVDPGAVEQQADGVFAARKAGQVERGPVSLLTQILFVWVDIAF